MSGARNQITAIIAGMLSIVIGLIVLGIVNTQAATTGSAANIGSFSGVQSLNDLIPLVFVAVIIFIGVGLFAIGGISLARGAGKRG